jgi:hypothetical protein
VLPQAEADAMLAMTKRFRSNAALVLAPGVQVARDLDPVDPEDAPQQLLLDVHRASIRMTKYKYQQRGQRIVVLARLDVDGPPHTNPDGVTIGGTHLHTYREGFEDKWAHEVDPAEWTDLSDLHATLTDFCGRFNIIDIPPLSVPLSLGLT